MRPERESYGSKNPFVENHQQGPEGKKGRDQDEG